jgi:N utilization substance protein B
LSRRTARKNAFLALYQSDVTEQSLDRILARWRSYRGELDEYAQKLSRGVEEEIGHLDKRLNEVAVGWRVRRMSSVDRTILRLALYEMLYVKDVPAEIAIGEAVELAKGFSGEEAPQFVGGVLRGAKETWLEGYTEHYDEGYDRRVEHG